MPPRRRAALLTLACGLFGCGEPSATSVSILGSPCSAGAPGDSALLELGEAKPAEAMSTVVNVLGASSRPLRTWVEVEPEDGEPWATPASDPTAWHRHQLRGLRPSSVYRYQMVGTDGVTTSCSAVASIGTAALDPPPPPIAIVSLDPSRRDDSFTAFSVYEDAGATMGSVILDADGEVVWYREDTGANMTRLSDDGRGVLTMRSAMSASTMGVVEFVSFSGEQLSSAMARGAHLTFAEVEPGTYAAMVWTELRQDPLTVADLLVEFTIEGEQEVVWSSTREEGLLSDDSYLLGTYPADESALDLSHANFLTYDADRQRYYLILATLGAVLAVDRESGELLWTIDAAGGSFAYDGEQDLVAEPHSVQPIEGGLLVFNRAWEEGCSEAVEIALDEGEMVASVEARHQSEECFGITWMGQAERLENGNTAIAWSTAGLLDQLTPEGQLARRLELAGGGFIFGEHRASLYGEDGADER
jgi:outer membrane protein assembly factor BamB